VVLHAAVQQRALGYFVHTKFLVNQVLVEEFKRLVELAIHALAFDQNPECYCFGEYFVLHHAVLGLNGAVHVLEVDTDVNQTVEQHVIYFHLLVDQLVHEGEALVECGVFVQLLHVLLDSLHQGTLGETVRLQPCDPHVLHQPLGLVHVVYAHKEVHQSVVGNCVHGQVRSVLDLLHQSLAQFPVLLQGASLNQGIVSDQVGLDVSVRLHLLELAHGTLKVECGYACVNHAVL